MPQGSSASWSVDNFEKKHPAEVHSSRVGSWKMRQAQRGWGELKNAKEPRHMTWDPVIIVTETYLAFWSIYC